MVFRKRRDGSIIMAKHNPIAKERLENAPEFQRTRENNVEFRGAHLMGKNLRKSSPEVYRNMHTLKTPGRLFSKLVDVTRMGPGIRGERTIQLQPSAALLEGFDWVDSDPFDTVFVAPNTPAIGGSRNDATWTIPAFDSGAMITFPKGATHFRLFSLITVISDMEYDPTVKTYVPTDPGIHMQSAVEWSAYIPVRSVVPAPIVLNPALAGVVMTSTATLVMSVGVEFSQEANGNNYAFAQNNTMRIVKVG